MTMIDKVTKTILDGVGKDCCHKKQARWIAVAVIKAIRKPTKTMIDAADVPMFSDFMEPERTWETMIEAALKEAAESP